MFDISLLYKLKKGNREAFNSVFRYYYPRIMAYVASIVEQKAAEDIVEGTEKVSLQLFKELNLHIACILFGYVQIFCTLMP